LWQLAYHEVSHAVDGQEVALIAPFMLSPITPMGIAR